MNLWEPQTIDVFSDGDRVIMRIRGAGTLELPVDAAHRLARALMNGVAGADGHLVVKDRPHCPTCGR